jgi:predicted RNA-binding protein with RPS1 domain
MIQHPKYAALGNEGAPGFNWDTYADGWNGVGLKENKRIKLSKRDDVKEHVFCHEPYAQSLYNKMKKIQVENVKDIKKGASLSVSDLSVADDNTLIATVGHGASCVSIDLSKETNLFRQFSIDNEVLDKERFLLALKNSPEFKQQILSMNLVAKIGTDTEKGSIWDGWVESLTNELKEQITLNNKAYYATVISTNGGGFVVEISGTIKAFMPGSMAASNRITDYESLIGRTLEVMVESWSPRYGFVVSRKKYLNKIRPIKLKPYRDMLEQNPDYLYHGVVTGSTTFGIFVELDECVTGMLHKSQVNDDFFAMMNTEEGIAPGTEIDVYVHTIFQDLKGTRVVLSMVPKAEREALAIKRGEEGIIDHIIEQNVPFREHKEHEHRPRRRQNGNRERNYGSRTSNEYNSEDAVARLKDKFGNVTQA